MSAVELSDLIVSIVGALGFPSGLEFLSFKASVINSLAWPVSAVIIAVIVSPHLKKLIGLIDTIKYKGSEVSLRESVREATNLADSVVATDETIVTESFQALIDSDPRITVLKSWARIEESISALAEVIISHIRPIGRMPTGRLVDELARAGVIDRSLAEALFELGNVRNLIAHGHDIPIDARSARDYSVSALRMASIIEDLTLSSNNDNDEG